MRDIWRTVASIIGMLTTIALVAAVSQGQYVTYRGYTYRTDGTYLSVNGGCRCAMCDLARRHNSQVNQQMAAANLAAAKRAAETAGTPREAIAELLPLLALDSTSHLVDIGCGDGRILMAAAAATDCQATGIEVDTQLANQAATEARKLGMDVQILHGDARTIDADWYAGKTVYVYLFPDLLAALSPKLSHASRVVSFMHEVPGLPGRRHEIRVGQQVYPVFVWQMPRMALPLSVPHLKS